MDSQRFQDLSKLLSKVLRPKAAPPGLTLRQDGSIEVATLLRHPFFCGYTLAEIVACVEQNQKQRFSLVGGADRLRVRACAGYTDTVGDIDMELSTTPPTPIVQAVHYSKANGPAVVEGIDQYMQSRFNLNADDTPDCWVQNVYEEDEYIHWHHDDEKLFRTQDSQFEMLSLSFGADGGFCVQPRAGSSAIICGSAHESVIGGQEGRWSE